MCLKLDKRAHTLDIHATAKVNYLEDRRLSQIYMEGFNRAKKCQYVRIVARELRCTGGTLLKNKLPHTESYKKSLEYLVSTHWNSLDVGLRRIESKQEFKNKIKAKMKVLIPSL